jgi:hypothetical protein
LIEEAAAFPNGAHDDQVDATSQALARLLLDGTGAQAWTEYLRRLATGEQPAGGGPVAALDAPTATTPDAEQDDGLTPLERARQQQFRQQMRGR